MTNKPILSVERELLEVIAGFITGQADAFPLISVPRGLRSDWLDQVSKELRALLDSPPQAEGLIPTELVELLRADLRQQVESAKLSLSAQNLGEPVALQHMAVSEGGVLRWMTGRKMQDCELYAMPDGSAIRAKLFVQQPAPVAILLPERMVKTDRSSDEYDMCADAHNDCLDAVARLNRVTS